MTREEPICSVVLVAWNRAGELPKLLRSLDAQTIRDRLEIIVVDNGSSDGTLDLLRGWPTPLVLYRHPRNDGPGVGRNIGVRLARAPHCCFIDTDAWLEQPDILERLVAHLDADAACCGAATLIYLDAAHEGIFARGCYLTPEGHFDAERTWSETHDPHYLTTCFCVYRRADIAAVGGFDPWYGYGIEDADLGCRVRARTGGTYWVDEERAAIHEMSMSGRAHRWDDFAPKFRYLEWMRHYLLLRRDGVAGFVRTAWRLLRPAQRGLLGRVYQMRLRRGQRIKALIIYPVLYTAMLPWLLVHMRCDHLARVRVDPARVERLAGESMP